MKPSATPRHARHLLDNNKTGQDLGIICGEGNVTFGHAAWRAVWQARPRANALLPRWPRSTTSGPGPTIPSAISKKVGPRSTEAGVSSTKGFSGSTQCRAAFTESCPRRGKLFGADRRECLHWRNETPTRPRGRGQKPTTHGPSWRRRAQSPRAAQQCRFHGPLRSLRTSHRHMQWAHTICRNAARAAASMDSRCALFGVILSTATRNAGSARKPRRRRMDPSKLSGQRRRRRR